MFKLNTRTTLCLIALPLSLFLNSCLIPEAEPGVEVNTNNPNIRAVKGEGKGEVHCYAAADLNTEVSCAPVPIENGVPMQQRQQQLQPGQTPASPIPKW
jgi:hypothetical protein